ncbi:MAG: 1-acyl-sn-glycerol-3-phosphate acyltransferase, partial [Gracilimonas sp.]
MRVLFSIFVFTYFGFLFFTFFVIISLVFLLTFPFDKYRKAPNYTLSIMAKCMMKASPSWQMEMDGMEKYDPSEPTI